MDNPVVSSSSADESVEEVVLPSKENNSHTVEELLGQENLFWAFPIEVALQREVREIALSLHHEQVSKSELAMARRRFVDALNKVIDAGFEFYYQTPAGQESNLSPLVKRTVDSIINTVRHAIHLVVQRVFKNMPLHELKLMGYYMDSMIIPGNEEYAHLAFPLGADTREEFYAVGQMIASSESTEHYANQLAAMFSRVVKESTHYYYHAPTDLLKLNRIVKKAADFGIDSAANGIEKIIRRVVKDVPHERVAMLFRNLDVVLITAELDYQVASANFVANK